MKRFAYLSIGVIAWLALTLPAFAAQGMQSHFVIEPVFKAKVYMEEGGKSFKDTIILVHGLSENAARDWSPVIPTLLKQYHVVTFDLPGFGRSSKTNQLYSPQNYAKFLKWVVDYYSTGAVIMVGHSMGGAIALRYANLYPETLKRLVLVDVAGVLHRSVFVKYTVQNNTSSELSQLLMQVEDLPLDFDTILASESLRGFLLLGDPFAISTMAFLQEKFSQSIDHLAVPTRILWGAKDEVTPLRTGKLLAARIQDARLTVIEGAGHMPMFEKPALFVQALVAQLDNKPAPKIAMKASSRKGVCKSQDGKLFTGAYDVINISGCKGVKLENVQMHQLVLEDSSVEIENAVIETQGVGIVMNHATLLATALDIRAKIGIQANQSQLDLAGVYIQSQEAAIASKSESKVTFSVSKVRSVYHDDYAHGVFHVTPEKPL